MTPLNPCLTDEDRGLIERVCPSHAEQSIMRLYPETCARLLAAAREEGRQELAEAREALLRADKIAGDLWEGNLEAAQQANAEGDREGEKRACLRADSYARIINAMQPALGAASRAEKVSRPTPDIVGLVTNTDERPELPCGDPIKGRPDAPRSDGGGE